MLLKFERYYDYERDTQFMRSIVCESVLLIPSSRQI